MDLFQSLLQYATTPVRKSKSKVEEIIHREELQYKKLQSPMKIKKKVQFELNNDSSVTYSELEKEKDNVGFDYGDQKCVTQVKILMRKEEAARLLSKCKQGRILEFKDVANELVRIPNVRVNINMKDE